MEMMVDTRMGASVYLQHMYVMYIDMCASM